MKSARFVSLACAALSIACTQSTAAKTRQAAPIAAEPAPHLTPAPPRPLAKLRFAPVHQSTGVDGAAIRPALVVDNWGDPVDEGLLAELAAQVSLVTWPARASVAVT